MKKDFFRTDIARAGDVKIDKENAVIHGFAVVTKGVTKDSRGEFDDQALDMVVDLGNKSNLGVKSRFGHPNMSGTALGTFLGRVSNFIRSFIWEIASQLSSITSFTSHFLPLCLDITLNGGSS